MDKITLRFTDCLAKALAASRQATAADFRGARGCARCYVTLCRADYSRLTQADARAVLGWANANGLKFQRKAHYGLRDALYLGYDNATGLEAARAEAFARALNALAPGYRASAEFGED